MTDPSSDMPTPAFARDDSPTLGFLRSEASGKSEGRFPARNFLLDEGVIPERADSYHREAGVDFADGDSWAGGHRDYLRETVYLDQARGVPKSLDPRRHDRCPETFRHEIAFRAFGGAYRKLRLARVVKADFVAREGGAELGDLLAASRELVTARAEGRKADEVAAALVDDVLVTWGERCDLRPVWASFLQDHDDLFAAKPTGDADGWANELRNRLGMSHVSPPAGSAIPILVFDYPVSAVPDRRGFKRKPLAIPTVVDGDLSPAFCPAPGTDPVGRVVHLGGGDREPVREVVHPFFVPAAKHLFRVGEVQRLAPADLSPARVRHLRHLREQRPDYGDATDSDLLGATP